MSSFRTGRGIAKGTGGREEGRGVCAMAHAGCLPWCMLTIGLDACVTHCLRLHAVFEVVFPCSLIQTPERPHHLFFFVGDLWFKDGGVKQGSWCFGVDDLSDAGPLLPSLSPSERDKKEMVSGMDGGRAVAVPKKDCGWCGWGLHTSPLACMGVGNSTVHWCGWVHGLIWLAGSSQQQ